MSLHVHELEQKLGVENGMDTTQSIEEKQGRTWTESDHRLQEYITSGRDKMIVDPYSDEIYTKRKTRLLNC